MIRNRLRVVLHAHTLLRALLNWWLLLGTVRSYHRQILGLPMPHFSLALSAAPSTAPITPAPGHIRSSCHCGSLVFDVAWNSDKDDDGGGGKAHRVCAKNCHCRGCRRYHTGAFASFLEMDSSNISVRKGRDKIGKYLSHCRELGPVERWFCTDCASKLLTVPLHLSVSLDNTADIGIDIDTGGDSGSSVNDETDPIDGTTRCLLNLGPVVEDGIRPDVTNAWQEQLERTENNLHLDETSAVWAHALPVYDDGDDDDDNGDDDDDGDGDDGQDKDDCDDYDDENGDTGVDSNIGLNEHYFDDYDDHNGDSDSDGDDGHNEDDCDDYYDECPRVLPTPLKWLGGCACGACRYNFVLTHPIELQHCYCHLCRELSGSPFMTWIPVDKDDFRWTVRGGKNSPGEGTADTTISSSSSPLQLVRTTPFGSRHICRICQSVMTIVYDEQPDQVWPCAGSLDDSTLPEDTEELGKCLGRVCHICCRYHPTWLKVRDDGMERMEEAC